MVAPEAVGGPQGTTASMTMTLSSRKELSVKPAVYLGPLGIPIQETQIQEETEMCLELEERAYEAKPRRSFGRSMIGVGKPRRSCFERSMIGVGKITLVYTG